MRTRLICIQVLNRATGESWKSTAAIMPFGERSAGARGGMLFGSLIIYVVLPKPSDAAIPRNVSDEESYCKDFSLPLEMTVWTDFERLFELLSVKMPPRRHKAFYQTINFAHRLNGGRGPNLRRHGE